MLCQGVSVRRWHQVMCFVIAQVWLQSAFSRDEFREGRAEGLGGAVMATARQAVRTS
jgi:hypothetical protein